MPIISENDQKVIARLAPLAQQAGRELQAAKTPEENLKVYRAFMLKINDFKYPKGFKNLAPVAKFEPKREIHPGLTASVATPKGRGPFPVHVHAHGHGLRAGSSPEYEPWIREMASHGFVVVFTDYRWQPEATYENQIEDMMASIAWVKANAKALNVDADRMTLGGDSAAGRLAFDILFRTLADPAGPRFKAVVGIEGNPGAGPPNGPNMLDQIQAETAMPPVYMAVGTADPGFLDSQLRTAQKLRSVNKHFTHDIQYGMPHDFMKFPEMDIFKTSNARLMAFLNGAV